LTTMLSPHFSLEEMILSQTAARMGNPNLPSDAALANLTRLADVLEDVRTLLGGVPILISSGYRCEQVNDACGGAKNSAHISGLACDFSAPAFGPPYDICVKLQPHMHELGIDQLIYEFDAWVHLGLSASNPRAQCLTINHTGTNVFV
jgi:zinc D-Ala-D-Ala carboxypeptidase